MSRLSKLVVALVAPALCAQARFADLAGEYLPATTSLTVAIAAADFDRDGDQDLVFANRLEQNELYLGDGKGALRDVTTTHMPVDAASHFDVSAADLNGDGWIDLVFANSNGQNRLYLNAGNARFVDATAGRLPPDKDQSLAVAIGDVDADGDPDIVFGNRGQNRLLLNRGDGVFTDSTNKLPISRTESFGATLGDLDGDRDLDLMFANTSQDVLLLNDGLGAFRQTAWNPGFQSSTKIAIGDVDGDSDADVVVATGTINRLWLNDGKGGLTAAPPGRLPSPSRLTDDARLVDLDGDMDLDILFANVLAPDALFWNDGKGTFRPAAPSDFATRTAWSSGIAVTDLDSSRGPDVVFGRRGGRAQVLFNDGKGAFAPAYRPALPPEANTSLACAAGDLNGDSFPDLVIGNSGSNRVYLNDTSGGFRDATPAAFARQFATTNAVTVTDLDGDGDLDILFGNDRQPPRLYLNDGRATFVDRSTGLPTLNPPPRVSGLAASDVDGDRRTDIFLASNGQNRLFRNSGGGRFVDVTATSLPVDSEVTSGAIFEDVDRDGDVDLVLANGGFIQSQPNRLLLNDGKGRFSEAPAGRFPARRGATSALAVGDVDRDGDIDVFFGNSFGPNRLYLNDGKGTFKDVTDTAIGKPNFGLCKAMAVGDIDQDGDLDWVRDEGARVFVHLNDGAGRFPVSALADVPQEPLASRGLRLTDLDRDDDLDLVVANGAMAEPNRVYWNLNRQIAVQKVARLGGTMSIEIHARATTRRGAQAAIPLLGTATTAVPIPGLGLLRIAPTGLITLPVTAIDGFTGIGRQRLPLPPDPLLANQRLFLQPFVITSLGARLGNVTEARLYR